MIRIQVQSKVALFKAGTELGASDHTDQTLLKRVPDFPFRIAQVEFPLRGDQ